MKQRWKRTLAALLTVAMLVGAAPLPSAQAEEVQTTWQQPVGPMPSRDRLSLQTDTSVQARTYGAVAWEEDRAATRGEVVEMLLAAADDYHPGVTRGDIIRGYENGDLREDQSVTRAEALVMLARAFGPLPERKGVNAAQALPAESFSDVPVWAAETLAPVFEAGLVAGTAPGVFSPNEAVTVHQMELFIRRTYALFGSNERDDYYATVNKEVLDQAAIWDYVGSGNDGTVEATFDQVADMLFALYDEVNAGTRNDAKARKLGAYHSSVMDAEGRNAAGIAPIADDLEAIAAAQSLDDLCRLSLMDDAETGLSLMFGVKYATDPWDTSHYMLALYAATPLAMSADYAGADTTAYDAYVRYLTTLLTLSGKSEDDAARMADNYMNFEKPLAEGDAPVMTQLSMDEVEALFASVDVSGMLQQMGYEDVEQVCVSYPERFQALAAQLDEASLETVRDYLYTKVIVEAAPYLSEAFIQAKFDLDYTLYGLYPQNLGGQAVSAVRYDMNDYVSQLYMETYGNDETVADVRAMCEEIREVFRARIEALDWMSDATKAMALRKLEAMDFYIGGPDVEDAASPLDEAEILAPEDGGSYFSNAMAIRKAKRAADSQRGSMPVDVEQYVWQNVGGAIAENWFYSPSVNAVILPMSGLQAPVYDPTASEEENLASLGFIIAHEITHAFDSDGAFFDETGSLSNWWTDADWAQFEALCEEVVAYYDGWECVPGIAIDGGLTLSENIADLGALSCLMDIAATQSDFDYEVFFEKVARFFADTFSREWLTDHSLTDPHSISSVRVNRLLSSCDAFYDTYDVQPGDGMYVAPEDRVGIW